MAFLTGRLLALLVCVGLLAMEQGIVQGLRSIDLVHRPSSEHGLAAKKPDILKNINVANLNTKKRSGSASSPFHYTRMSKRRVRRGSDPIHNKS
ncbi:CLAVATA3/ESR (CLE)-related protein 45 [Cocos nucifera]|nr:CLAVATA3/ESR (CLE)-related protein 45 [Cocos nucifera]